MNHFGSPLTTFFGLVWVLACLVCPQEVAAHDLPKSDGSLNSNVYNEVRPDEISLRANKQDKLEDEEEALDFEYEDDVEEDFEDDPAMELGDSEIDDSITEEDLQDIKEARRLLDSLELKSGSELAPGSTVTVNVGDVYYIYSHYTFGSDRYPNWISRRWWFNKGVNVKDIVIYCPFFKIQWSRRCRYDKFAVFKGPSYVRGIRRCGQIHGFYKKYEEDVKIVFKSNGLVRRAGFCCKVVPVEIPPSTTTTTTFAPGCPVAPTLPAVRQTVNSCSDILPGYPYCTCIDHEGGICLLCEICNVCETEFFAVHDFSNVDIYLYVHFPCPEFFVDLASFSFGFETSVVSVVNCFSIPPATHYVLPLYPFATTVVVLICPASALGLNYNDICDMLISSGTGRRNLPLIGSSSKSLSGSPQKERQSLSHLPKMKNLVLSDIPADLSTFEHRSELAELDVDDPNCSTFPNGSFIDLRKYENLQTLTLTLCLTSCPQEHILLNSSMITSINLNFPNAPAGSIHEDCVVNYATTSQAPTITITTSEDYNG